MIYIYNFHNFSLCCSISSVSLFHATDDKAKIESEGSGLWWFLHRTINKVLQPTDVEFHFDTGPCLPEPIPPAYHTYKRVGECASFEWVGIVFWEVSSRFILARLEYFIETPPLFGTSFSSNFLMLPSHRKYPTAVLAHGVIPTVWLAIPQPRYVELLSRSGSSTSGLAVQSHINGPRQSHSLHTQTIERQKSFWPADGKARSPEMVTFEVTDRKHSLFE